MANERWSVKRTERTWTSSKEYIICDGKKETIKVSNLDDAKAFVELLNKVAPKKATAKKSKSKKTTKESKEKSAVKK